MLSKVQAKQALSFAIILGDLFARKSSESGCDDVDALLKGEITVPLPTYFMVGQEPLPTEVVEKLHASSHELCHNLFFLGRRSTFKTSEGIKIVTLGGSFVQEEPKAPDYLPYFTEKDARVLHGANSADILLSNEWPLGVSSGSRSAKDDIKKEPLPASQQCISNLCSTIKPRYHFSPSPTFFFEREPFWHAPSETESTTRIVTRFISLGSFRNSFNAKFIYAFSLDPVDGATNITAQLPLSITPSPFTLAQKRRPLPDQRFQDANFHGDQNGRNSHRRLKRSLVPAGPEECFFCISNPEFEKHMVVSIGNESYVTISKGPLPTLTTFPALGSAFPAHMLIIPFSHTSTLSAISDVNTRSATFQEMLRYCLAMNSMLHKLTATALPEQQLSSVTFEVSRSRVRHIGWQWLPVPADYAVKGLVEAAFRLKAEDFRYAPFIDVDPDAEVNSNVGEYFRVWVPVSAGADVKAEGHDEAASGETKQWQPAGWKIKSMYIPIAPEQGFDLQFGRKVMAGLLQAEGREKWDLVRQSADEETECAERFKEALREFDFTLKEEE